MGMNVEPGTGGVNTERQLTQAQMTKQVGILSLRLARISGILSGSDSGNLPPANLSKTEVNIRNLNVALRALEKSTGNDIGEPDVMDSN